MATPLTVVVYAVHLVAQENTEAFTSFVQRAVGDEILTPEEEDHVQEVVRILGVDLGAFLQQDSELGRHVKSFGSFGSP